MAENDWGAGFDAETDFLGGDLSLPPAAEGGATAGGASAVVAAAAPAPPKRLAAALDDSDDDDADFATKYAVEDDDDEMGNATPAAPVVVAAPAAPALPAADVAAVAQQPEAPAAAEDVAVGKAAAADHQAASGVEPSASAGAPSPAAAVAVSPSRSAVSAEADPVQQEEPQQQEAQQLGDAAVQAEGSQQDQLPEAANKTADAAPPSAAVVDAAEPMAGVDGPAAATGAVEEDAISTDFVMATADEGPSLPTSSTAAAPVPAPETPAVVAPDAAPGHEAVESREPAFPPVGAAAVPAAVALVPPKPQSPRIKALRLQVAPVGPTVSPQQAAAIVASKQQFQAAAPQRRPLQLVQPAQRDAPGADVGNAAPATASKPTLGALRLAATTPLVGVPKTVPGVATTPSGPSTLKLAPLAPPTKSPAPAVLGALPVQQVARPAAATPLSAKTPGQLTLGSTLRQSTPGAVVAAARPLGPANANGNAAARSGGGGSGKGAAVPNKALRLHLATPVASTRAAVEAKQQAPTPGPLKAPAAAATNTAAAAAAAATALALPARTVSKLGLSAGPTTNPPPAALAPAAPMPAATCSKPPAVEAPRTVVPSPPPQQQQVSEPMDVDSCSAKAARGGSGADTAGCSGAVQQVAPALPPPIVLTVPAVVAAPDQVLRPAAAAAPAPVVAPAPVARAAPLVTAAPAVHSPQLLQPAAPAAPAAPPAAPAAPRPAAAKMADAMERLQGMLLAMQSLEDDVVSVRLGAALEAGRLVRLDNPMIARRIKTLTDAATAAVASAPLAPSAAAAGEQEPPLMGDVGALAAPVVLPGPLPGPLPA